MTIHVFNDPHGFFLNRSYMRLCESSNKENLLFVNLNSATLFKEKGIVYLNKNLISYRKFISHLNNIDHVNFYPFDYVASCFFQELRKKFPGVRASWIFWSYEFYQRPGNYHTLLMTYSKKYYERKKISSWLLKPIKELAKKLIFMPVYNSRIIVNNYKNITDFYSLLPADFKNISETFGLRHINYHPFSFLTIEEEIKDVNLSSVQNKIIIGHAAAPTGNHAEIINLLSKENVDLDVLIPLEYGDKIYASKIKELAKQKLSGKVETIETRMELSKYNSELSKAGFAVYNFITQEGLGNILFLAWHGTKIFLNEESTVYKQFREWGIRVFSVNMDLNKAAFSIFLPIVEAENNRKIIEALFNEKKVLKYWEPLID
jgi:dTDP-N-acetylfucosamine:lipid II N-acetylfucosaminyltransferase